MKKLILLIATVMICSLLFGCNQKKEPIDNGNGGTKTTEDNTNTQNEEIEIRDAEYKEPDFTDKSDFKVEKSEELSNVSYDSIFLRDEDNAQLDLRFEEGKVGSLLVSKKEIFVSNEDTVNYSLNNTEVTTYTEIDGIKHYVWEKEGFYFEFMTSDNFQNEEIEKIVKGYSAK